MFDMFKDIASGADILKEITSGVAVTKTEEMLHEFNETIRTVKGLGLSVSNVSFKMGLPPEIGATFTGLVAALDQGKLKDLIAQNKENKMVTLLLEALTTVSSLKDQLRELDFWGVKMDVRLGLSPHIEVGLLTKSDTPAIAK
jgi:hypothetical protein